MLSPCIKPIVLAFSVVAEIPSGNIPATAPSASNTKLIGPPTILFIPAFNNVEPTLIFLPNISTV